jgi:hypothetical protein
MKSPEFLAFLQAHRWAIEATSSLEGVPQAAIIGFAVTPQLEMVFDTLTSTRKAANLQTNPRVAFVIGGWNDTDPKTLQYEGRADFPQGEELSGSSRSTSRPFPMGPRACHGRGSPTCGSSPSGCATATSASSRPSSPSTPGARPEPVIPLRDGFGRGLRDTGASRGPRRQMMKRLDKAGMGAFSPPWGSVAPRAQTLRGPHAALVSGRRRPSSRSHASATMIKLVPYGPRVAGPVRARGGRDPGHLRPPRAAGRARRLHRRPRPGGQARDRHPGVRGVARTCRRPTGVCSPPSAYVQRPAG